MKHSLPENPFPVTGYLGRDYFCDREEETRKLISNLKNGNSTTLVALRRIGKTGLIKHVMTQLPAGWKGIYVDILETENLNQFLNLLTTSLLQSIPEKSSIGKKTWNFVKTLRPVINFDALTGYPQATFESRPKEAETNIHSIFQFIENQNFKTVIAVDEFQQILNYPEKNTDAWLRTRIQQMKNTVFIFSGSQQHLMNELFSSPKRPFFRSTQMIKLEKIDLNIYQKFIIEQFAKYKKKISASDAVEILEWCNNHTYYVQQLCNRLFASTSPKTVASGWQQQAYSLLKEQETVFFYYRNLLTISQWQLLKAIAAERIVYQPTSMDFITKHSLGTSATVLRSLKSLTGFELVYQDFDIEGRSYYSVYDVFFQRWVKSS